MFSWAGPCFDCMLNTHTRTHIHEKVSKSIYTIIYIYWYATIFKALTAVMNNINHSAITCSESGSWHSCGCKVTLPFTQTPLQIKHTSDGTDTPWWHWSPSRSLYDAHATKRKSGKTQETGQKVWRHQAGLATPQIQNAMKANVWCLWVFYWSGNIHINTRTQGSPLVIQSMALCWVWPAYLYIEWTLIYQQLYFSSISVIAFVAVC